MSSNPPDDKDVRRAHTARNLRRIAVALGQPDTAFLDGGGTVSDLAAATELIRLWNDLPSDEDRRKVLAYVRSFFADTGARRLIPP